jgi:surface antigen
MKFRVRKPSSGGRSAGNSLKLILAVASPPPPNQFQINVQKLGNGLGLVTSNEPGIDCGDVCNASFVEGDSIELSAQPADGSTFVGWGGACEGTSACIVSIDSDKAVTANFRGLPSGDTLSAGQTLEAGESLSSVGGQYYLVMQTDGNLVFRVASSHRPIWASHTDGNPGAYLAMQTDGNLVIYAPNGGPDLWASGTNNTAAHRLAIQTDSNLVLYSEAGQAIWASGLRNSTLQTDETLIANQYLMSPDGRFKLIMQGDGNLVGYPAAGGPAFWDSNTDGHPGAWVAMQGDGNLVVYSDAGSALWPSNTAGHPGAYLALQTDRNLVVYGPNALWASNTALTTPPPAGSGDDYPYKGAICQNTGQVSGYCSSSTWTVNGNVGDPWNFIYRNCTSWVAFRLNKVNGVAFHNYYRSVHWGNAKNWDDAAVAAGIAVNGSPARGAVAQTNSGDFGHVAWVKSVNGDGTVTIEEYNRSLTGVYSVRTVSSSSFQYIHIKDI